MKQAICPLRILTGVGEDVDGTPDTIALPTLPGGGTAEIVLVTVTEDTYVLPVLTGGAVATTTGIIVTPESGGLLLNVMGLNAIAHVEVAASGNTQNITVNPVDA